MLISFETNAEVKTISKSFLPLYPLCCAISTIPDRDELLVTAAFDNYSLPFFLVGKDDDDLVERATLQIGEDWSTNLNFAKGENGSLLRLAIGNHDHLVRVLNIKEATSEQSNDGKKYRLEVEKKMLSNSNLELKMETILYGHANWVTASAWFSVTRPNSQLFQWIRASSSGRITRARKRGKITVTLERLAAGH